MLLPVGVFRFDPVLIAPFAKPFDSAFLLEHRDMHAVGRGSRYADL